MMFRLLVCLFWIGMGTVAAAEKRVALLIGNDAYQDVAPLLKARADAQSMAEALDGVGFETILALDVTRRDFNLAIAKFTQRLEPGDTAFVFYAGHGVEIEGENYLLPTDILVPGNASTDFVTAESIPLSGLLDRVRSTGARTVLAVIDACRNNPFPAQNGRSLGRTRGLGRIAAPEGTFVVYSAGAGQLALDELVPGEGAQNSVFTRLLLPKITTPGLELRDLISDLRVEVRDLAGTQNHSQFPAYYDELLGEFYFSPAAFGTGRSATTEAPLELPSDLPGLDLLGAVVTTKGVDEAASDLAAAVQLLGGEVYATIDHRANGASVDQNVGPAKVLLVGDPKVDVMALRANPLSGLILPLKMMIFDHNGQTIIAYEYPEELFDDLDLPAHATFLDVMQSFLWAAAETAAR